MMKIVLINHTFQSKYYTRRWQLFAESHPDFEVTLLTLKKFTWYNNKAYSYSGGQQMSGEALDIDNFHIRTFRQYPIKLGWTSPDFKRLLLEIKPDFIYHIGTHTQLSLVQVAHIARKYLPKAKLILFSMRGPVSNIIKPKFNGINKQWLKSLYFYYYRKVVTKYVYQKYDAIFCHYPDAMECFRNEGFTKPLYMQTQVGVNTEWFHPNVEARNVIREKYNLGDAFVFGSATRFTLDKGIDDIIRALPDSGNWKYLLMGTGSPEDIGRISSLISERGLQDKVIMTGFVNWYEIADYWNAIDCAIHVPRTTEHWVETFSLSVIQPMATGKPIIANTSGSVPYQVNNPELIVNEGDLLGLREKLVWIMGDRETAKQIGEYQMRFAIDSYSITHLNDLFYRTLIEDIVTGEYDNAKIDMRVIE